MTSVFAAVIPLRNLNTYLNKQRCFQLEPVLIFVFSLVSARGPEKFKQFQNTLEYERSNGSCVSGFTRRETVSLADHDPQMTRPEVISLHTHHITWYLPEQERTGHDLQFPLIDPIYRVSGRFRGCSR